MRRDIDNLIQFIAHNYPLDDRVYPELKGKSEQEKLVFAVRHLSLHFSKTAGKISALSETTDHGGQLDVEALKDNVSKSLINTLRLAELIGMSEKDLIKAIEEKYSD